MPRVMSLSVELALGLATAAAFAGVIAGGPRAARWSRIVTLAGAAAAFVAAVVTLGADAVWFFEALRMSAFTQALKGGIAAALLASVLRPRPGDAFARARTVDPFFRLVVAMALSVAASAGDIVVLWIALDIASLAGIIAVATAGGWSASEAAVRAMVRTWLPSSLACALGVIVVGGIAGATRFTDLEVAIPELRGEPALLLGLALIGGSIVARAARFAASSLLAYRTTH